MTRAMLVALLWGCTRHRPWSADVALLATVPIRVAEYQSNGMVGDNAAGNAYVYDDFVRVVIRRGRLMLTPKSGGRERLTHVTAALAYGDSAGWKIRRESQRMPARDIRGNGDVLRDSIVFVIPNIRGLDLTKHWVILKQYASLEVPGRPARVEGTRPLQGDRHIFASVPVRFSPP